MNSRAADIFSQFEHIRERMQQAYRQVIGAPGSPRFTVPYMEPAIDIYETADEVIVLVELAAISGEEVELEIESRTLILRGERKPLPGPAHRLYSQMEISHGPFQRELFLPADVNAEQAHCAYRDGILELVLPKAGGGPSRQLRIVAR